MDWNEHDLQNRCSWGGRINPLHIPHRSLFPSYSPPLHASIYGLAQCPSLPKHTSPALHTQSCAHSEPCSRTHVRLANSIRVPSPSSSGPKSGDINQLSLQISLPDPLLTQGWLQLPPKLPLGCFKIPEHRPWELCHSDTKTCKVVLEGRSLAQNY